MWKTCKMPKTGNLRLFRMDAGRSQINCFSLNNIYARFVYCHLLCVLNVKNALPTLAKIASNQVKITGTGWNSAEVSFRLLFIPACAFERCKNRCSKGNNSNLPLILSCVFKVLC